MARQLYFVAVLTHAREVGEQLRSVIGDDEFVYKLDEDKWFVSFDGIARDLAEKIGIRSNPSIGTGLVIPAQSWAGRAPTQLWDWLKLRAAES